jgi:hypothetical protein
VDPAEELDRVVVVPIEVACMEGLVVCGAVADEVQLLQPSLHLGPAGSEVRRPFRLALVRAFTRSARPCGSSGA